MILFPIICLLKNKKGFYFIPFRIIGVLVSSYMSDVGGINVILT